MRNENAKIAEIAGPVASDKPRLLIMGDESGIEPRLCGFASTTDPGADVDAVVLGRGVDAGAYSVLHRHGKLLLPILDASGGGLPRADAVLDGFSNAAVTEALTELEPLRERLDALPPMPVSQDRDAMTALSLAVTRACTLEPKYAPDQPECVCYPLLSGLPEVRPMLEELASSQLLARRYFDRLHSCPVCDSSRLNVREECEECRSSNISEESLVHHYRCAFQASERRFEVGEKLICPKCRRELRHFGVDYDKPGCILTCTDCGHDSSDPAVGFLCLDCGTHSEGDRVDTRPWYHYEPTPDAQAAVDAGILPFSTLESIISHYRGAYALRDFLTLLQFQRSVVQRYERPLTLVELEIRNVEALRRESGARSMNRAFAMLAEIVSETLRRSDAVAATGTSLYILLPETDALHTQLLGERIIAEARKTLAVALDISYRAVANEELEALIESLGS